MGTSYKQRSQRLLCEGPLVSPQKAALMQLALFETRRWHGGKMGEEQWKPSNGKDSATGNHEAEQKDLWRKLRSD